ncbi:MAG: shikimate kinase [Aureispira sp.]|nr:shikimate kinase [Aureispira sp.]
MERIFIVGFMGSGKSAQFDQLAKKLKWSSLDFDGIIEYKEKLTIKEIFDQHGEGYFRGLEQKYLRELGAYPNMVIATGGGTPCFHENMEWMNQNGVTIFIDTPAEAILANLQNETDKRPLLAGKTAEELKEYVEATLVERRKYYEQATHTVVPQNGDWAEEAFSKLQ